MAILSNPLFATYSVYARNASTDRSRPAFQGHSRSSEPTWIDPLPTTPYQHSIATMGLSGTISVINVGLSSVKNRQFFSLPVY